jgi:hypothetical protein
MSCRDIVRTADSWSYEAAVTEEKRRAKRHGCRFRAQVRFGPKTYDGQIIDLSASGMRLSIDRKVELPVGWKVEVLSEELGAITGYVQWQRPGSFGVKLELSSNTRAKVDAAWRNFIAADQASQSASPSVSGTRVTTIRSQR